MIFLTKDLTSQQVSSFAGSGNSGGLNGPGTFAQFDRPYTIYIDSLDNLYITEPFGHRIRKIDKFGNVVLLAGTGNPGFQDGPIQNAQFNYPWGIFVEKNGDILIGDNENERVRKISNGIVSTIAGSGIIGNQLGPALTSRFNKPYGVCSDETGNIYFIDRYNHQVKKLTVTGTVVLVAGSGMNGHVDGPGLSAAFHHPQDISIDKVGNLYVSDRDNNAIRKISPSGVVSTLAGGGNIGFVDGIGSLAKFNQPHGLFFDDCENLYVADIFNHAIRKIAPSGLVSTVAGTGSPGYINGDTSVAKFNMPWDIVKDSKGNLFITDSKNNRIRKISNTGCVKNDSTSVADPDCKPLIVPNAFSPNGDGSNDGFSILNKEGYELISFQIYNRWGNILFEGFDINDLWDGNYKDTPQPAGVYAYLIKYTCKGEVKSIIGNLTLLR